MQLLPPEAVHLWALLAPLKLQKLPCYQPALQLVCRQRGSLRWSLSQSLESHQQPLHMPDLLQGPSCAQLPTGPRLHWPTRARAQLLCPWAQGQQPHAALPRSKAQAWQHTALRRRCWAEPHCRTGQTGRRRTVAHFCDAPAGAVLRGWSAAHAGAATGLAWGAVGRSLHSGSCVSGLVQSATIRSGQQRALWPRYTSSAGGSFGGSLHSSSCLAWEDSQRILWPNSCRCLSVASCSKHTEGNGG